VQAIEWHHAVGDEARGPLSTEALQRLLASGALPPDTLVWHAGMSAWMPAADRPELWPAGAAEPRPPAAGVAEPAVTEAGPPRRRERPLALTLLAVAWGGSTVFGATIGAVLALAILEDEPTSDDLLGLAGLAAVALVPLALQGFAAVGVWTLRPWGLTVARIRAVVGLLGFPLGTLINATVLGYLSSADMRLLFAPADAPELSAEEAERVRRLSSSGLAHAVGFLATCGVAILGVVTVLAVVALLDAA